MLTCILHTLSVAYLTCGTAGHGLMLQRCFVATKISWSVAYNLDTFGVVWGWTTRQTEFLYIIHRCALPVITTVAVLCVCVTSFQYFMCSCWRDVYPAYLRHSLHYQRHSLTRRLLMMSAVQRFTASVHHLVLVSVVTLAVLCCRSYAGHLLFCSPITFSTIIVC